VSQSPQTETPAKGDDFLRHAGEVWSHQTPEEADSRWHRVDPDVEL